MGRIQSDVGLITGIRIGEIVEQLMALQAAPRDRATAKQADFKAQQTAISELLALALGIQIAGKKFKEASLFTKTDVSSSNASLLTAVAGEGVSPGTYQFVAVRRASTSHVLSSGLAARDEALPAGTVSFRLGGAVNEGVRLSELNAGAGVAGGKIRITDRSGAIAVVDLRYAQTIDDVIAAINANEETSVQAVAVGQRLRLVDSSGGSGTLKVQEVGSGTTAADLGLDGINVSANSADGDDILRMFSGMDLSRLGDGSGLSIRAGLADLHVTLRDGTSLDVDFHSLTPGAVQESTLGEVLTTINAANPAKLKAEISADGDKIVLTDLSTDSGGTFAVTSPLDGSVAEELGLTGAAVGGVITGKALLGGLQSVSLRSLNGGQGIGTLGLLNLTDRNGDSASVNLATATTLDEVIDKINAAGLGITASFNSTRNGLLLKDTTGATTSNLIVANGDANNSATKLQIAVNAAQTQVDSGELHRQVVSYNTLLSSYNQGQGVQAGSFLITDSSGATRGVNLTQIEAETVGDVIDEINGLSFGVEARINDTGDGILLIDTAGGAGTLTVSDVGSSTTAADLHLAGTGEAATIDGQPAQIIDGTTTATITLTGTETLEDLVTQINDLDAGVTASIFTDSGGSLRYHLSLLSTISGEAGDVIVDATDLGLTFHQLSSAQDALVQYGDGLAGTPLLLSSSSNTLEDIVPGLDITLTGQSTDPVTITVASTPSAITAQVQLFVDQYNKLREKLGKLTFFNEADQTKGLLFGSSEALRLDVDLSRLITGRYLGVGSVQTLAQLGVSVDENGKLSFDKTKLEELYASDPEAVTEFFSDEDNGFGAKADAVVERLTGEDNSILVNRVGTLQRQVDDLAERIEDMNERLERNRERLLSEFYAMEEAINKIKNNLTAISQIQYISPIARASK